MICNAFQKTPIIKAERMILRGRYDEEVPSPKDASERLS